MQKSAAKLSSEAPGTYELCGGLPVADAAHVVLRDGDGSGGYFYSCELRHPTLPNPGKIVFVPIKDVQGVTRHWATHVDIGGECLSAS